MKNFGTLPAEADRPCDCCGRMHRKLFYVDAYWMGKSCATDYSLYKRSDGKDVASLVWKGYESKFYKVQKMVKGV
jgi:hypothetical protein